jgi:ABC-type multidrug transport system fused ATPase/permease subunit
LIGGFYFPSNGEVLIDGMSTKEINLNDLRSNIAYVSQDIAIFNTTIGENISYGLNEEVSEEEKDKRIKEAAKLANISDFIKSLPDEYNTKVGEKGLKLSGGQKQRIAIARAILRNPKILILDEPTSALDIESETKITSALKEVMKNRTTIIIAHRISTVRDTDNIFVFKNGKVVESGNYKKLTNQNGEFKKMVDLHKGLDCKRE